MRIKINYPSELNIGTRFISKNKIFNVDDKDANILEATLKRMKIKYEILDKPIKDAPQKSNNKTARRGRPKK